MTSRLPFEIVYEEANKHKQTHKVLQNKHPQVELPALFLGHSLPPASWSLQPLTTKERRSILPVSRQEMEQLEESWAKDGNATIADIRTEGKEGRPRALWYLPSSHQMNSDPTSYSPTVAV